MNSSSKVPPRFVPTLTDVVPPAVDAEGVSELSDASAESGEGVTRSDSALDESLGRVARILSQESPEPSAPATPSARASFHSPWLADGLYVRGKPATIPHQLPPLPESLPPQQPFAERAEMDEAPQEVVTDATAVAEAAEQPEPEVLAAFDAEALPLLSDVYVESAEPVVSATETTEPIAEDQSADETAAEAALSLNPDLGGQLARIEQSAQTSQLTEDYLVHRLMQRVDLVLEKRLKEAVEQVVEAQTRSLVLRLREELESVVRHSVYEAVEAELELQAPQKNEN